ncbi:MAG: hypothetical protein LC753_18535 [Acidobacteria bacterium]|nr:hypothetical protein [Acidobacteriota bacterium]MCA1652171.1 hypothetical protein [Acidobacteriota bacterium]
MGLYRSLLKLLPKDFRGDFGEEMEAVFDAEREDARRAGRVSVLKLWSRTVAGMLRGQSRFGSGVVSGFSRTSACRAVVTLQSG